MLLFVVAESNALTSDSLYRRCPPRVLIEVSFPDFAQRVTVFGSTRNKEATSAGVSRTSWSELTFTTFQRNLFANVHFVPYGTSIMVLKNKCHLFAHIACSKDATLRQRVTSRS